MLNPCFKVSAQWLNAMKGTKERSEAYYKGIGQLDELAKNYGDTARNKTGWSMC